MLNGGRLDDGVNDTVITLISKKAGAIRIDDFRPISLCNVVSKIIPKVLANRLKFVLPELISESQSAFMKGHMISDNFLLAHELAHYIKSRRHQKSEFLSLKTDISKAYGRVE